VKTYSSPIRSRFPGTLNIDLPSTKFTIEEVLFLENMKPGCKLERDELSFHCESHACQPANSPLMLQMNNLVKIKAAKTNNPAKEKVCKICTRLVYVLL